MLYRVGNCKERTIVGRNFAEEEFPFVRVEMFQFRQDEGDHAFLVIGRDPNSKPSDYKNWGKDAVVCDSWSGAGFPASSIESYLLSYKGQITDGDNIPYTLVKPFGSTKETLELIE